MEHDFRPARRQPPTLGPLPVRLHARQHKHKLFTFHFHVSCASSKNSYDRKYRARWLDFPNVIQNFTQGISCLSWAQEVACQVFIAAKCGAQKVRVLLLNNLHAPFSNQESLWACRSSSRIIWTRCSSTIWSSTSSGTSSSCDVAQNV